MPNELIDRIQRAEAGELTGLYDYVRSLLRNTPGIEESVLRDGVTIVTAWDEALLLPGWGQSGDSFTRRGLLTCIGSSRQCGGRALLAIQERRWNASHHDSIAEYSA